MPCKPHSVNHLNLHRFTTFQHLGTTCDAKLPWQLRELIFLKKWCLGPAMRGLQYCIAKIIPLTGGTHFDDRPWEFQPARRWDRPVRKRPQCRYVMFAAREASQGSEDVDGHQSHDRDTGEVCHADREECHRIHTGRRVPS